MAVEKLCEKSKTSVENVPFAQISNLVTEHIKDNDAYRIWAFSFSKSRNWKILKEFTQKICGVGERKGEFVWSYLKRCGLIEYKRVVHHETGKFIRTDIKILNGSNFNINEPFLSKKTTPALSAGVVAEVVRPVDNSTPALSAAAEMPPLLNKDKQNIDNKSFYASHVKKSTAQSKSTQWSELDRSKQKFANEQKHSWSDPKAPLASVTNQSTSHNPDRPGRAVKASALIEEHMEKMRKMSLQQVSGMKT